jgi:hypothetical protein
MKTCVIYKLLKPIQEGDILQNKARKATGMLLVVSLLNCTGLFNRYGLHECYFISNFCLCKFCFVCVYIALNARYLLCVSVCVMYVYIYLRFVVMKNNLLSLCIIIFYHYQYHHLYCHVL